MLDKLFFSTDANGYAFATYKIEQNAYLKSIRAFVYDATGICPGWVIRAFKKEGNLDIEIADFNSRKIHENFANIMYINGGTGLTFACKSVYASTEVRVYFDIDYKVKS